MRIGATIFLAWLIVAGGCFERFPRWGKVKGNSSQEAEARDSGSEKGSKSAEAGTTGQEVNSPTTQPVRAKPASRPVVSIEPAILTVSGETVTAEEILIRCRPELQRLADIYSPRRFNEKAKETIYRTVRGVVEEILLYKQIAARIPEEQNPAVEKVVDREVNNLAVRLAGGSKVRLEKLLEQQGATLADLRKQLRRKILTRQYLREKFRPKVIITRDDLWQYYKSHRSEFDIPARVRPLILEIEVDKFLPEGRSWSAAKEDERRLAQASAEKQLKTAQRRLSGGEDFRKVARELATASSGKIGGDIGWISQGSYRVKQVEQVAFNIALNQVSDPIKVDRKYYIIKVIAFEPARRITFSEAQATIKPRLEQQYYDILVARHLAELWKKARTGSMEPFLRELLARMPSYEELKSN